LDKTTIMKIVLVTGGFDPLHSGHIEYFKSAKALGDKLIVGLNSDTWLERKKGRAFMPITERVQIVENLKAVDGVVLFNDNDGTAIEAIRNVKMLYPDAHIIFANGGDRTKDNIPEMVFDDVEFVFGIGGSDKKNSSSWILEEWKSPKTKRPWGYYRVLHDVAGAKVKELTVEPGESLSMQRHKLRNEYWLVTEGDCLVESTMPNGYQLPPRELSVHDYIKIPVGDWHRLSNPYETPCRIVEIQYGTSCDESDIERRP
jgi:cytidyltransferase-like protein